MSEADGAVAAAEKLADQQPVTQRAEETLDRAGEQAGIFLAEVSHRLRKSVALAREEAEDMWAEAQSLRRKNLP